VERFVANVEGLVVGDPMDPDTDVGPLISHGDRDRVLEWIAEAAQSGGEVLTGGELTDEDRCLEPTVIREPSRDARVWCDEIFGPVATLHSFGSFDEALELANEAHFGLQAGVFTSDIELGLEAARQLEYGAVLINEVPTFRADQMPYGGVKESGNTREGPAYAVRELTEERLITLQG
jgi:acyl-CoA reductase-like NAD-dependent aldehyde dehydrogenase